MIPCKNEEGAIGKTIEKCFQSNYPADKLEVIIVNDGSTDRTIDVLNAAKKKFKNLIVVDWEVNQGKRLAMGEGFRRAKGEIIVQLDSDSYLEPKDFPNLIAYFANPEVGAVCAHAYIENAGENFLTKMQSAYYYVGFRVNKAAESTFATVLCCSGCSSAYRKELIMPILDNWLNEKFLGLPVTWGDNRGLTNWVLKSKHKTIYTDSVSAYTIAPSTWKQFMKQQIRWKKGWFVNSYFVSKFLFQQEPYVAFIYFLPLTLTSIFSPFISAYVFIYDGLFRGVSPLYYVTGAILVNLIILIYCKLLTKDQKYLWYIFPWTFLNMLFLTYVLFYALATIQNRKWGTR